MSITKRIPILSWVVKLWDPVQLQLWIDANRHLSGPRAFAIRQTAIFFLTFRHLRDDEISRRAAALTYYSLLSLVPLLAVGFALFKAFGGLRKFEAPMKQFIIDNLAVGRADEIGKWLDSFISNISAGAIAGVGLLVLFYSAIGLLTNTEKSFNRIWGVHRMRPLHLRFAIYWCLITLAPPLLGLSLSLSAQLQRSSFATATMAWLPFGIGKWLVSLTATLAICIAFVLAYLIVPYTRVRLKPALLGGLVAGLLWSGMKALFLWASAGSAKYNAIYGALSALPLLIIWLYYSWLITLFGMTYTFANQTVSNNALLSSSLTTSPAFRLRLASRLFLAVIARFRSGASPLSAEQLAQKVGVLLPVVESVLVFMVEQKLLIETEDNGYVPGRDLAALTLADLSDALWNNDGAAFNLIEDEVTKQLFPLLDKAAAASCDVLAGTSPVELLPAEPAEPGSSKS